MNEKYPPSVVHGIPKLGEKPSGWEKVKFNDVLNRVERPARIEDELLYQLITAKRNRGGIVPRDEKFGKDILTKNQYYVVTNDFVISKRQIVHGGCGVVPVSLDGAIVSNEYLVLHPVDDTLLIQYLNYYAHTEHFQLTCFHASIGVDIEKMLLRVDEWLDHELYLPPLPEQRKIAQILSTWDDAIALVDALITTLSERKKGLMQRLLTGETRFSGFDDDWEEVRLGDVADIKGGKRLPKGNQLSSENTGYPYIRVSDMTEKGINVDNILFVPPEIAPKIENYRIFKDDLYISVAGTIGLVGTIPLELDGANLTENADRLTNIRINKSYLYHVMRSQIIRREIDKVITQNAQPKLALTRLRGFNIPLPNNDEQESMATLLNMLDDQIHNLEKYSKYLREQKKGLMQRLLTGAVRVKV